MSEKEIVNDLIMISKYLNKNIKGDIKEILKCALEKVENRKCSKKKFNTNRRSYLL